MNAYGANFMPGSQQQQQLAPPNSRWSQPPSSQGYHPPGASSNSGFPPPGASSNSSFPQSQYEPHAGYGGPNQPPQMFHPAQQQPPAPSYPPNANPQYNQQPPVYQQQPPAFTLPDVGKSQTQSNPASFPPPQQYQHPSMAYNQQPQYAMPQPGQQYQTQPSMPASSVPSNTYNSYQSAPGWQPQSQVDIMGLADKAASAVQALASQQNLMRGADPYAGVSPGLAMPGAFPPQQQQQQVSPHAPNQYNNPASSYPGGTGFMPGMPMSIAAPSFQPGVPSFSSYTEHPTGASNRTRRTTAKFNELPVQVRMLVEVCTFFEDSIVCRLYSHGFLHFGN
jgi:hypothetical protein